MASGNRNRTPPTSVVLRTLVIDVASVLRAAAGIDRASAGLPPSRSSIGATATRGGRPQWLGGLMQMGIGHSTITTTSVFQVMSTLSPTLTMSNTLGSTTRRLYFQSLGPTKVIDEVPLSMPAMVAVIVRCTIAVPPGRASWPMLEALAPVSIAASPGGFTRADTLLLYVTETLSPTLSSSKRLAPLGTSIVSNLPSDVLMFMTYLVDIFAAAGLKRPDISILSDEFLADVRGMPQRNLAVELLQKLIKGEIRTRGKHNVVQARSFAELLEQAVRKYQNRAIETAQVIEELIQLAKDMRAAGARGEQLGLSEDELAFYDALESNDSAVKVLGDDTLRVIARELVETVRKNVTIDWTIRDNVQAQLRVLEKRTLRKHGYPPDKQEKATQTVLEQAALLSAEWAI